MTDLVSVRDRAAQEKEKELREKLNVITRVVDGIRESRDRAGQSLLQCKVRGDCISVALRGPLTNLAVSFSRHCRTKAVVYTARSRA